MRAGPQLARSTSPPQAREHRLHSITSPRARDRPEERRARRGSAPLQVLLKLVLHRRQLLQGQRGQINGSRLRHSDQVWAPGQRPLGLLSRASQLRALLSLPTSELSEMSARGRPGVATYQLKWHATRDPSKRSRLVSLTGASRQSSVYVAEIGVLAGFGLYDAHIVNVEVTDLLVVIKVRLKVFRD